MKTKIYKFGQMNIYMGPITKEGHSFKVVTALSRQENWGQKCAVYIWNIFAQNFLDNLEYLIFSKSFFCCEGGFGARGPGSINMVSFLKTSHVDQGVWVLVSPQKVQEKGAVWGQNDLVSLYLMTTLTGQGDISKLCVLPQCSKCRDGYHHWTQTPRNVSDLGQKRYLYFS